MVLVLASSEPSLSSPASQLLTHEGRDKSPTHATIAARDVQTAWRGTRAGIALCLRWRLRAASLALCDSSCLSQPRMGAGLGSPARQGAAIMQESRVAVLC